MNSLDGRPNSCGPSSTATNLNPPNPHMPPAPWNGSPSRTNRAEPQLLRRNVCTRPRAASRSWRENLAHLSGGDRMFESRFLQLGVSGEGGSELAPLQHRAGQAQMANRLCLSLD